MRFQTKLMLVFILLLIAVICLMSYFNYRNAKRLLNEVEQNLQELVSTVHFSTRKLSTEKGPDREFLEKFIDEFKSKKGVKEVSIVSSRQEIIASSNPKRIGHQERSLSGKEIVVEEQFGFPDSGGNRKRYEVRMPLIRDDRVIGLVQTSISLADFSHLLRENYLKNIGIALAALLVACGASFFIIYRLNRPIRSLSLAAEKVAFGDLTVQLDHFGKDEMGRLTNAFNGMILKLAEQKALEERLRSLERQAILAELASTLAHEIRNPLNLINLTADHLGDQFRPEASQKQEGFLNLIHSLKIEVKHLNLVVSNFLSLGSPKKLQMAPFHVNTLIDQVEIMIKQQLTTRGITFQVDCAPNFFLNADQEQLRLVLLNLILNSLEAVPNGGRILLHAGTDSMGFPKISVSDNGQGVEPQNLKLIFDPYFSKREGGTGLGLALVRRIIEEHGGNVLATNNLEGGLKVEITLVIEG